ncbi:hypothetical protein P171DRAFT_27418 [Karstenula rhodostoma CBS 690.94]|uniref:BTB domain-containing protein n=1 Tax=Karstenula rhodostoma CBS 690.94 TaxID=1392251 RepID=A0A9P4UCI4_9PLEO|nr:hypothetical protein P171DRAFT_27418 [Karstenula rhodostoma CBS 690.94]
MELGRHLETFHFHLVGSHRSANQTFGNRHINRASHTADHFLPLVVCSHDTISNLEYKKLSRSHHHLQQQCTPSTMTAISLGSDTPKSPTIFVTVDVGAPHLTHPHRDTFLVTRADLTRSSLHLRTRLASPQTTAIDLHDVDARLFSSYLDWLDSSYVHEPSFHRLAELFAFAARLQDADFSRAVLRDIIDMAHETDTYPDLTAINIIYGASKRGSGARKLLTDFYVYGVGQAWLRALESAEEKVDRDYIDQVLVALATRSRGERELPWVRDASAYLGERGEDEDGDEDDSMSSDMSDDEAEDDDSVGDMADYIDSPHTVRKTLEEQERVLGEDSQTAMDIDEDHSATPLSTSRPPAPGLAYKLADRTRS